MYLEVGKNQVGSRFGGCMDGSSEIGGLAVGWGQVLSVEVPIVMFRWTVRSAVGVSGVSGLEPEVRDPPQMGGFMSQDYG